MEEQLDQIEKTAESELLEVSDLEGLNKIRTKYLGRSGKITEILKNLKNLDGEDKKNVGSLTNKIKVRLEELFEVKEADLKKKSLKQKLKAEAVDVTLPGWKIMRGSIHPLTQILQEVEGVFCSLGYTVAEGPEVETEYHNFDALNIPAHHPSRDMWSTFYLKEGVVLRTHTSPVQIRVMKTQKPPIFKIMPGRCYRNDQPDLTHSPIFHQVEGLAVDRNITFADLKGTLTLFARRLFGSDKKVRFRPSYFPFTEPSVELDVECVVCKGRAVLPNGENCKICKATGWLEIMGAGMVDPNVFEAVGYDPKIYSGFAFGMGIERIAMLRYDLDDIRVFFENDIRFLKQF